MYWFRTKTILIILFFCINIFLLVNMIISTNKSIVVDNNTIDNTLEVLSRNNIYVDRSLLPKKVNNHPLKLQIKNTLINMDDVAKEIFNSEEYNKYNDQLNKTYEYAYNDASFTVKGSYFKYINSVEKNIFISDETVKKYIKKFVKSLGVDTDNIYFREVKKMDDGYYIICNYKYKDSEIFGPDIEIEIDDKVEIKGYSINPLGVSNEKIPVIHVTGILIKFLSEEKTNEPEKITIKDISLGYRIEEENLMNELKELKVAPVWEIKTASNNIYYYKALK